MTGAVAHHVIPPHRAPRLGVDIGRVIIDGDHHPGGDVRSARAYDGRVGRGGGPGEPFQADLVLARGRVPKELAGRPVSASWTARSVALVADRSSPGSPRSEDLAVIPLGR